MVLCLGLNLIKVFRADHNSDLIARCSGAPQHLVPVL